mgnify:FL=1
MARDMFSVLIPMAVGVGLTVVVVRHLMKKTGMDAEHESALITSPTENEMLMRGLLVRPTVNAQLNAMYGSAPSPVSISTMTDMIVGTPLPRAIYS